MACLVRRRNAPYWYCCCTTPKGQRLKKSTKQTDRVKAWEVCVAMVNAEGAIAAGSATEGQLRKVINDALERAGERKLNEPTIKEQLDNWIENKNRFSSRNISERTSAKRTSTGPTSSTQP